MAALAPKDIRRNRKFYKDWIERGLPNGWEREEQQRNFLTLCEIAVVTNIPLAGRTALDVGCGTGDLSSILRKMGVREYTGIDIYKKQLKIARKIYPGENFIHDDFLRNGVGKFDYVFCSGTISLKLSDNDSFTEEMLRKMWDCCRIGVAFSYYPDTLLEQDKELFYHSLEKIEEICRSLNGKYHSRDDISNITTNLAFAYIVKREEHPDVIHIKKVK